MDVSRADAFRLIHKFGSVGRAVAGFVGSTPGYTGFRLGLFERFTPITVKPIASMSKGYFTRIKE